MAAVGLVASILLGLVFLVSGGSKLAAGPGWPEQARGLGAPSFVVPVLPWFEIVLGAGGVEKVLEVALDADERKLFDASIEHVRSLTAQIQL